MKNRLFAFGILAVCAAFGETWQLSSPDGSLAFALSADGDLGYSLVRNGRTLIEKSELGFAFAGEPAMKGAFEAVEEPTVETGLVEAWTPVVKSRHAKVRLVYNRLVAKLREKGGERRRMDLTVQAYDEGVAFRYTLFGGIEAGERFIEEELTAYRVPPTAKAFIGENVQGFLVGSQECVHRYAPVTEIKPDGWTLMPLVLTIGETDSLALASACLVDYPCSCVTWRDGAIRTHLAPTVKEAGPGGVRARFTDRFDTPWRVILAADHPGKFMENEVIRALNPPCAIADTSWIKAGKAAWDHWWSGEQKMEMPVLKEYIDLAGSQGWPYMIVDTEWYGPFGKPDSDVTTVAPQIDMPGLVAYAAKKGVRLFLWVDSHDLTRNDAYRTAFPLYRKWGIVGVKIDFMDRSDREMVNWYRKITACAAENRLLVDFHGAFVPDGMDRTYPNQITREGVLGAEYTKFGEELTPAHHVNLAYTRLLAGPMDYTPGGFLNVAPDKHVVQVPAVMPNTRAQELAKFVVYESPLTVVCDHPTNLLGQAGFEFVSSCPVEWDDTRFIGGRPSEWVAVARRNGAEWYVGVIGGNDEREVTIDLGFIGRNLEAQCWTDGAMPREVVRETRRLPADGKVTLKLAPGGGAAMVIKSAATRLDASAQTNGEIWYDTNGHPINAHGSGVLAHEGRYYLYGEHKVYGEAGNFAHVGVHVYSSDDLRAWKDEGIALAVSSDLESDIADGCILERPKVVYCAKTGQFVMYFHLERRGNYYTDARVGIATSKTPTGPFAFVRSTKIAAGSFPVNATAYEKSPEALARSEKEWEVGCGRHREAEKALIYPAQVRDGQDSRDMTLFVDDDAKCWLIHSSERNSTLHITELTDDYLDFTGRWWRTMEKEWTEAPSVCKKDGWYYLIGSDCTGWAPNDARLYRARKITGPWERVGNPCRGVNPASGIGPELTWGGQSNFILKTFDGRYIAMFDIWNPKNQIDSRYVWLPVEFHDGALTLTWRKSFE